MREARAAPLIMTVGAGEDVSGTRTIRSKRNGTCRKGRGRQRISTSGLLWDAFELDGASTNDDEKSYISTFSGWMWPKMQMAVRCKCYSMSLSRCERCF